MGGAFRRKKESTRARYRLAQKAADLKELVALLEESAAATNLTNSPAEEDSGRSITPQELVTTYGLWQEPSSSPRAFDPYELLEPEEAVRETDIETERADSEFAIVRRRMVDAAAQAIENVQVRWIPETIHDIGYHKPGELAEIIRGFL